MTGRPWDKAVNPADLTKKPAVAVLAEMNRANRDKYESLGGEAAFGNPLERSMGFIWEA